MMETETLEASALDVRSAIQMVADGGRLTIEQATEVMNAIMTGEATGAQIGALVTALRMRGETIEEITGFAAAMRTHALKVDLGDDLGNVVDTCGTGGDGSSSFNISTTASFVIAGAGGKVAKHGNRAASSRCGSADLLEGLGVRVTLAPEDVAHCIRECNIGFMFAQAFHPAMRFVGPTRREIGIRTVFNILGPLTNPASAKHQLIGVGRPEIAAKLAKALAALGSEHAVLVHAGEGMDELGLAGESFVTDYDARRGHVITYNLTPDELGLGRAPLSALTGGDVAENVAITRAILDGETGPRRDVVLLNAGAGLFAANLVDSIADGIELSRKSIDSGRARAAMEHLARLSQSLGERTAA